MLEIGLFLQEVSGKFSELMVNTTFTRNWA